MPVQRNGDALRQYRAQLPLKCTASTSTSQQRKRSQITQESGHTSNKMTTGGSTIPIDPNNKVTSGCRPKRRKRIHRNSNSTTVRAQLPLKQTASSSTGVINSKQKKWNITQESGHTSNKVTTGGSTIPIDLNNRATGSCRRKRRNRIHRNLNSATVRAQLPLKRTASSSTGVINSKKKKWNITQESGHDSNKVTTGGSTTPVDLNNSLGAGGCRPKRRKMHQNLNSRAFDTSSWTRFFSTVQIFLQL